jgi:hypothetical protein
MRLQGILCARCIALYLICLMGVRLAPAQSAASITGSPGLSVTVNSSGAYDIFVQDPIWHFGGSIGSPLSNISQVSGADANGSYNEITFTFQPDVVRHAFIRAYSNQPAVLFTTIYPVAAANRYPFPNLTSYPSGLNHIAFSGVFANPTFSVLPGESPWAFFDQAANTFVISPAANFMTATTAMSSAGAISSGIDGQIATLPQGFTHSTLLVIGKGVNHTFDVWGNTLSSLQGKARPASDADSSLKLLGYWTDNGATYYYHTQGSLSYADTLATVKAGFDTAGIGLGYMQLDSWFYPKGPNADWSDVADGLSEYQAAPVLFGSGLSGFQQRLGIPLITHARWIDTSSPYRQQYAISGNVSTDPAYWSTVAGYLKNSGVATYEQDWLSGPALPAFNLTDGDAFLGNMSSAAAQRNLTIQYCMPTPRHVLQSSKYGNVTSIRVSQDRFSAARWTSFLYASRLVGAVGAYPFTDVLMSSETSNLLLATLSAGPVGIGDAIGNIDAPNLLRSVRQDGVIVKPDAPITPLDSSFLSDSQMPGAPMVASTYSNFGGLKAYYVFAYPQGSNLQANFTTGSLGMNTPAYVYDYFNDAGTVVAPDHTVGASITGDSQYWVVTPVGPSGMAVIGDIGQFVTLGKKRITDLEDNGSIRLTVAFANGEKSRSIQVFAPMAPYVSAVGGSVLSSYNKAKQRLTVTIAPAAGQSTATIQVSRRAPVAFRPH